MDLEKTLLGTFFAANAKNVYFKNMQPASWEDIQ